MRSVSTAPSSPAHERRQPDRHVRRRMFQIMILRGFVDHVAYMAHPHGIPFDDELLDDMHYIGDIKASGPIWSRGEGDDQHNTSKQLSREKMNDELSRKLKLFPQRPRAAGPPQPLRSAFKGSRPRPVSRRAMRGAAAR